MRSFLYIWIGLLLFSCAPTRFSSPLQKKEKAIGFNAGGPLIKFAGATIPIPFSSVYGGYGISEKSTAIAGIHTTSLLFGNAQVDLGLLHNLYSNELKSFQINGELGIMNIMDLNDNQAFRAYPSLAAHGTYDWGKQKSHRVYAGVLQWFDLYPNKGVLPEEHNYWLPSGHIGYNKNDAHWSWGFEVKYSGWNVSNEEIVVNFQTPFQTGNIGIYGFIHKRF